MSTDPVPSKPVEPRSIDLLAGFLSYLVPGLGQISQGRTGKGLLFMVSLLGMFFYGMHLGSWNNVYLPREVKPSPWLQKKFFGLDLGLDRSWPNSIVEGRLAFAGQFWIGTAAWPAILQYKQGDDPTAVGGSKTTSLWKKWLASEKSSEFWRSFQDTPKEPKLNELQAAGDKSWDLGWVYTVIAGVLNILVIYDALAGPAFLAGTSDEKNKAATPAAAPQPEVAAV